MREEFLENKKIRIAELNAEAKQHYDALARINSQKAQLEDNILNFVYDNLKQAKAAIEDYLYEEASETCGDMMCGNPELERDYIVNGIRYVCTGHFEYDRHDKRFYYLFDSQYTHEEIGPYEHN